MCSLCSHKQVFPIHIVLVKVWIINLFDFGSGAAKGLRLSMGGRQSTTGRRVQPSLPYFFHYNRLSPSPNSLSHPLLDNHNDQCMEQEVLEIEAYQKQSTAALEKEIRELRSRISRLESKPPSKASATTKGLGSDATFGKELDELKHRVAKLERIPPIDALMKKQESAIEQLKQANGASQKKIVELTSTVDELRSTSFAMTHTRDSAGAVIPEPRMDDLLGCLVVLILLVSMLIGVSL